MHGAPGLAAALFSDKVSSADADYDDAALEGMLHEAHRVHGHHSLREDLSVSLSSSSMSDRTGRPVEQRPVEHRTVGLCSSNKKSKFLQSAKRELTDTNFKPLTTEEVYYNWRKLLNLNKKNFIAIELKKFNNEINSFKVNYCSKFWNNVKLIREVSLKWKSLGSFIVPHSTLLQDEN